MGINYEVMTFILKHLYSTVTYIIKIVTMFIKATFKDSNEIKRIRNYVVKFNLYLYFLI